MAQELSHSMACGMFLDEGSNPCLLHWQAESLPLSHQASPRVCLVGKKSPNNFPISLIFMVRRFFQPLIVLISTPSFFLKTAMDSEGKWKDEGGSELENRQIC